MKAKRSFLAPSQIKVTIGLAKYSLLASLRNRTSFIFSLIFPLVFVAVFGYLGNSTQTINIGVANSVNHADPVYKAISTIASQANSPIKITTGDEGDLESQLSQDKIDSVLEPSSAAGAQASLTLVTSNANAQGKATSTQFLTGLVSQMNLQALQQANHATRLPFIFDTKDISGRTFHYIDFALPGQIGFSMLSLATFGIAFSLLTLRKTLVLKRMFATTVKPISFVIAQCLSRSVQAVLQAFIIVAVGVWGFHFTLANGWISFAEILFLSFLGILAFLGFGILISNIAKDEQSLPIAINLFNLPQILLAGVFFPVDTLPKWVQYIGNNLPLAYLNTAMRKVAVDGQSLASVWPYLLGLFAWALVSYILAARTFKTEPN